MSVRPGGGLLHNPGLCIVYAVWETGYGPDNLIRVFGDFDAARAFASAAYGELDVWIITTSEVNLSVDTAVGVTRPAGAGE